MKIVMKCVTVEGGRAALIEHGGDGAFPAKMRLPAGSLEAGDLCAVTVEALKVVAPAPIVEEPKRFEVSPPTSKRRK